LLPWRRSLDLQMLLFSAGRTPIQSIGQDEHLKVAPHSAIRTRNGNL
jgi:hypothetical protein